MKPILKRDTAASGKVERRDLSGPVILYATPGLRAAPWLPADEYARARAAIPWFCLDGLVCGTCADGSRAIVLVRRTHGHPAVSPFGGQLWVVGGRWDMVSAWPDFVLRKVSEELFEGRVIASPLVDGPIGGQLFATGWDDGGGGAVRHQGMTLQFCYRVVIPGPLRPEMFRPDPHHSGVFLLGENQEWPDLHPYVADVIRLSEWLR